MTELKVHPQVVTHGCGCKTIANHASGSVHVICQGSDGRVPVDVVSINRDAIRPCPGGCVYAVRAEEVRTVQYTSCLVEMPGGDAA